MLTVLYNFVDDTFCDEWRQTIDDTMNTMDMPGLNYSKKQVELSSEIEKLLKERGLSFMCNDLWYLTRYSTDMSLGTHRDGTIRMKGRRSSAAILIYISDGYDDGHLMTHRDFDDPEAVITVKPQKGMCVIVGNDVWHEASAPTNGFKYLLRSDLACAL